MRVKLLRRYWLRQWQRLITRFGLFGLGVLLCGGLLINGLKAYSAASGSVDAFFVLGGSITREVYVANLAKQQPSARVLISSGSQDPCIIKIFQQQWAPINRVWLEKCADSTFSNFYFNIPILKKWGVRKVKLITSPSHLPRAKWMAQILLGAQGIWVEVDTVKEEGVPGNKESSLKTGLDLTRSLIWAVLSQFIQPQCTELTPLKSVDMEEWRNSGFNCENQWWLKLD
ncbi:MAG: YdcF family protein [Symploca sp. SIO3C6]|uniref:YdcF family protein n=1 Tax=Symploca sp. SIO1C4 TaxID=2607765 RepID=A0A6B3NDE5_9CYAN|nr:YdcF family protein [Symploca sp. SIO3C6]NER29610.1 YdcF family protein [Symploca sp. SIO1C4]NET07582.1 YdcF family protein [Symploca sp. SIO2B6]